EDPLAPGDRELRPAPEGAGASHQTARELILLPYTQRTVTERPGGRGGGRDRGERGERGERAERTLSDTIGADAPRERDANVEILGDVEAFDRGQAGAARGDGGATAGSATAGGATAGGAGADDAGADDAGADGDGDR